MGRKTQISREMMLETGLQMLVRDGYAAINVSSLARELGCSTQPILWSFGSIDGYRRALRAYAVDYMQQCTAGGDTLEEYCRVGPAYVDLAIDKPNLIRYLRMDEADLQQRGGIALILDQEKTAQRCRLWVDALGITMEEAEEFVEFSVTHTQGIVSLILAGILPPDKEAAHRKITMAGEAYIAHILARKERSQNHGE